MKNVLFLFIILTTQCRGAGFVVFGARADGAVVSTSDNPTADLSYLGAPASPIVTYAAIAKTPALQFSGIDAGDGVPLYAVNNGNLRPRSAAAVAVERMAVSRSQAVPKLIAARQQLDAARALARAIPGNAQIQSQVSASASLVTSLASQAGIANTTATTQ